jgi:amino acid adenylation domain-containing protein
VLAPQACFSAVSEALADHQGASCRVITFEDVRRDMTDGNTADLATATPRADDLAYVMPTSGTTGKPRLVAVSHRSLNRYLRLLPDAVGVTQDDVCLHTAAFTFSASVRQLFVPLCAGATLVVAEDEERLDPLALCALIRRRGVTVWDTVPSVWRACIDNLALLPTADRTELLSNKLHLILTTGEPLSWNIPYRWRVDLGHCARVINLYSQTETAGTICLYRLPDAICDQPGYVPLGHPLPFVDIHLLDDNLRPVATGEVGEICVGGGRLASGYVGQAELTTERFALQPFQHEGFYRTGDLARQRSDGTIEFAGRNDHLVKIRGQRVELGEVEAALRNLPEVEDAAVSIFTGETGPAQLVAYLVARKAAVIRTVEIIPQLRKVLHDAALPAKFVTLDKLPRNAAGKLDRPALPTPESHDVSRSAEEPDSPHTLVGRVEQIFAQALSMGRVGHDENFFDLGGNSLLATVLITRLRMAFGVPFPIPRFFNDPTVTGVRVAIEEMLLDEVEALSDEEAARLLGKDSAL